MLEGTFLHYLYCRGCFVINITIIANVTIITNVTIVTELLHFSCTFVCITPKQMSQKEIDKLIELAQDKIKKGVSKEEALETFVGAGILNEQAQFTQHYKNLETIIIKK